MCALTAIGSSDDFRGLARIRLADIISCIHVEKNEFFMGLKITLCINIKIKIACAEKHVVAKQSVQYYSGRFGTIAGYQKVCARFL